MVVSENSITQEPSSDSPPVKLSVCIPTYNGAKYLGEAITSVLSQTLTDFELIIVDDCSTDATEAVIKSFSDSRIKYFQNPARLGLVGNWNRCLELSTGKYICLFHQDDVMLAENLERKIKFLEENPSAGMVYSKVFIIDAEGHVTSDNWFCKTEPDKDFVAPGLNFFETLASGPNIISCPGVMVRRECYEKLGGFDSRLPFTADWEMWMRIALFYDVAYLGKPLAKYRLHEGNESRNFQGSAELRHSYECKKIVLEKYPERIPNSQALRAIITEDLVEQALDRALDHYHRRQVDEAREYLAFALELHSTTIEHSSYDEYAHWLLKVIDKACQQPPEQQFNQDLSARQDLVARLQAIENSLTWRIGSRLARSLPGQIAARVLRMLRRE